MHPKNFNQLFCFLKRRADQNSYGETILSYEEVAKGWGKITFKSFDKGTGNEVEQAIYQVVFKLPGVPFHRIKWRGNDYNLKTDVVFDEITHTASVLIKSIKYQ